MTSAMPMEGSSMSRYLEVIALVRERGGEREREADRWQAAMRSAVCTRKDFSFLN